ncbi:MAG: DnaJ domain-containing protein [Planctomycetota bacterium]
MCRFTKTMFRPSKPNRSLAKRDERVTNSAVKCDLGEVVDLSVSGVRLALKSKPAAKVGARVRLRIMSSGQSLRLQGQVRWIRRHGIKCYHIGLKFIDVKKSTRVVLQSLNQYGFIDLDRLRRESASAASKSLPTPPPPIDLPDYYCILGVRYNATDAEIRKAYRAAARTCHPDVAEDSESAEQFKRVTEAYRILRDAVERRSYDQRRAG